MNENLIDIRLAVQQEIRVRKLHSLSLMFGGVGIILVTVATFFGVSFPVAILALLLLMYFFMQNQKEINRLVARYG